MRLLVILIDAVVYAYFDGMPLNSEKREWSSEWSSVSLLKGITLSIFKIRFSVVFVTKMLNFAWTKVNTIFSCFKSMFVLLILKFM